jgi:hypothetical protein
VILPESTTLLFDIISGVFAILLLIGLAKPQTFRFLLDKDSTEPSLGRLGQYAALVVSTWGFMWLIIHDKMTEFYFTSYMLSWAGAQFGSIFLKVMASKQPKTTP